MFDCRDPLLSSVGRGDRRLAAGFIDTRDGEPERFISGDADDPDGMVFTDERGRRIANCGRPVAPCPPIRNAARRLDIPKGTWSHPGGEPFDPRWVHFDERKPEPPESMSA